MKVATQSRGTSFLAAPTALSKSLSFPSLQDLEMLSHSHSVFSFQSYVVYMFPSRPHLHIYVYASSYVCIYMYIYIYEYITFGPQPALRCGFHLSGKIPHYMGCFAQYSPNSLISSKDLVHYVMSFLHKPKFDLDTCTLAPLNSLTKCVGVFVTF